MNRNLLFSSIICASLFVLMSCQNSAPEQSSTAPDSTSLSASAEAEAKKAISAQIKEIIKGSILLNADSALKPYADIPEFKIVNPDGSVMGYADMHRYQTEAFATLTAMKFETVKEEFTFLTKDMVICTWIGKNEFTLKTGDKMQTDPYVGSMTFKKINGVWKIIYAHETSAPPVIVE